MICSHVCFMLEISQHLRLVVCSGLDIWRCKIPELVQNLEESAIQANTASERLALQLQSVELQISMVFAFLLHLTGSLA